MTITTLDSPSTSGMSAAEFDALVTESYPRLLARARGLSSNLALEAEDLLHEALAKATECWRRAANPSLPWLYTVLRTTAASAARAANRRPRVSAAEAEFLDALQTSPSAEDLALDPLFEDSALEEALSAINPAFAEVLCLHAEGFEPAEIAKIQGTPRGTASSRMNRARRDMRAALAA